MDRRVEVCEICGNPPKKRALHRDHDHKTGKPRGLLCFTCNRFILGKYATAAKLRAAAAYLDKYSTGGENPVERASREVLPTITQMHREAAKVTPRRKGDMAW